MTIEELITLLAEKLPEKERNYFINPETLLSENYSDISLSYLNYPHGLIKEPVLKAYKNREPMFNDFFINLDNSLTINEVDVFFSFNIGFTLSSRGFEYPEKEIKPSYYFSFSVKDSEIKEYHTTYYNLENNKVSYLDGESNVDEMKDIPNKYLDVLYDPDMIQPFWDHLLSPNRLKDEFDIFVLNDIEVKDSYIAGLIKTSESLAHIFNEKKPKPKP